MRLKNIFNSLTLSTYLLLLQTLPNHSLGSKIVYERDVLIDDEKLVLQVRENEEPVDAIHAFEKEHRMESYRETLFNEVCKKLHCKRSKAKIWSTTVNKENAYVGTFDVFEDVEPVDAAHAFVTHHGLSIGYRNAILKEACDNVECNRIRPIVWTKSVNIDNKLIKIELLEGEEIADVIFEALAPYKVSFQDRIRLFEIAKADGVAHSRERALLLSNNIVLDDEFNQTLVIFDDGREPIDVLNEFVEKNNIEHGFKAVVESILPKLCAKIMCSRSTPVVWSHPVIDAEGRNVGLLEVLKNEEPIDAVYRFASSHNVPNQEAHIILQFVCRKIKCSRDRPVVYRKTVNDEHGKGMGDVEIYQGEEVIDAVVRFIRTTKIEVDHIAFKNHFFNQACDHSHVKCTRNIGHIYENDVYDETGKLLGKLIVTEYDEPADKVYDFCQGTNLNDSQYGKLIDSVCSNDLVVCKRKLPLSASLPMNDPDGNMIGHLEVQRNEEPVDALYRFFAVHNLFQKKWDFHGVLNQICALKDFNCRRKEALKYYAESIKMGEVEIGPLVIWEHQEVVDVLFDRRIQYNLTEIDQMITFGEICTKKEVYCARTQAKVYELKDITIKDYENFGNETCARKYAGWQFIESFVQSSIGSKARDFIQMKTVEQSIASPLFCPLLLVVLFFITKNILSCKSISSRIHVGHKVVTYFSVFVLVSLSQSIFIEPKSDLDQAMHIYDGKLPDIVILENQEPVDMILKWGKLAAKDHHPIVREPIYWDMLEKVCNEVRFVKCARQRAWEYIDMGAISIYGQSHKIDYFNPEVEPKGKKHCTHNETGSNPCVQATANSICSRIFPQIPHCASDLINHINTQLIEYDSRRLKTKKTYIKLGLEMDAPSKELFPRMAQIVRSHGMNVAPYRHVGNMSYPIYYRWDENTDDAFAAMDAYIKVKDTESREWNDKPCTPYFNGALCAKNDKEGNMIIEV